jgi:cation diffusion facilitator CzcD-associated flavoprotein CzcO
MDDVLIIGAGMSGLYQLHRCRRAGLSASVVESGDEVGGTWHWNRYPGARFDSESYSYAYSFSEELLDEWRWSEHFAGQPEVLRYLRHVADRFDLRRDITLGVRVTSAAWHDGERCWTVASDDGSIRRARYLVLAIGALSVPNLPSLPGIERFGGRWFHTAQWPREPVPLDGSRVAVIGTGATGVQLIQEAAKTAARLTVLQRTANWCSPLRNSPIDNTMHAALREHSAEIFARCRNTFGGFLHDTDRRKATVVSPEERTAFYEELYARPGFALWMGNFRDVLVDPVANATLSTFMAGKIRARVHDPEVAERLIPHNHGYGTRRVPLENGYYEVYNQPNVDLVDLRETPILEATPTGITTTAGHHEVDVIAFATGFDAVTGPFDRIDIRGLDGVRLAEQWADGPLTYLGLGTAGFPNMFSIVGPHNAAAFCNMPRCIEHNVEWVTDLLALGHTRVCATAEAQAEWTAECHLFAARMLFSKTDSWFTGRNRPGRDEQRTVLLYAGGFPTYQERLAEVAASGYPGFELS